MHIATHNGAVLEEQPGPLSIPSRSVTVGTRLGLPSEAAYDPEAHGDLRQAVRLLEQVQTLPASVHPSNLDLRLRLLRKDLGENSRPEAH